MPAPSTTDQDVNRRALVTQTAEALRHIDQAEALRSATGLGNRDASHVQGNPELAQLHHLVGHLRRLLAEARNTLEAVQHQLGHATSDAVANPVSPEALAVVRHNLGTQHHALSTALGELKLGNKAKYQQRNAGIFNLVASVINSFFVNLPNVNRISQFARAVQHASEALAGLYQQIPPEPPQATGSSAAPANLPALRTATTALVQLAAKARASVSQKRGLVDSERRNLDHEDSTEWLEANPLRELRHALGETLLPIGRIRLGLAGVLYQLDAWADAPLGGFTAQAAQRALAKARTTLYNEQLALIQALDQVDSANSALFRARGYGVASYGCVWLVVLGIGGPLFFSYITHHAIEGVVSYVLQQNPVILLLFLLAVPLFLLGAVSSVRQLFSGSASHEDAYTQQLAQVNLALGELCEQLTNTLE